jgi:hypothetical protein
MCNLTTNHALCVTQMTTRFTKIVFVAARCSTAIMTELFIALTSPSARTIEITTNWLKSHTHDVWAVAFHRIVTVLDIIGHHG